VLIADANDIVAGNRKRRWLWFGIPPAEAGFYARAGLVPRLRRSDDPGIDAQPWRTGLTSGSRPYGPGDRTPNPGLVPRRVGYHDSRYRRYFRAVPPGTASQCWELWFRNIHANA